MNERYLSLADVLQLHADQVAQYGGDAALRDQGLLESALAQPGASFGGQPLHTDLFEMAAAYMFHIVQNHPFADGNKRTGLIAALVFLDDNGVEIEAPKGALYDLTIGVATGAVGKAEIAVFFREHAV